MFKEERSSPGFEWEMIGDIEHGRPHLGPEMSVSIYRLMQYTLRDVLIQNFGVERADELFHRAGQESGRAFYTHVIGQVKDTESLFAAMQGALREHKIGIFRVESADPASGTFVITMAEDLDCSGIPVCSEEICVYDEGFFAGIMEAHTGEHFRVKEVDCWGNGDRVCRFTVDRT